MCAGSVCAVSTQGSNIGAQGLPQLAAVVTSSVEPVMTLPRTKSDAQQIAVNEPRTFLTMSNLEDHDVLVSFIELQVQTGLAQFG